MRKVSFFSFIALLFVVLSFSSTSGPTNQKESLVLKSIVFYVQNVHFDPPTMNDAYSSEVFEEYFDRLDPAKRFLLSGEIEELSKFKTELDDEIQSSNLDFFDASFKLIEAANLRAQSYFEKAIKSDFDFSIDENIESDYEKILPCETEIDLQERWRKLIKLQILQIIEEEKTKQASDEFEGERKSDETIYSDAITKVEKRYNRWFNNRLKKRRVDWFTTYVNSALGVIDPHTSYFKPKDKEDFDLRLSGAMEGIGARLTMEDDYVKIVSIVPGGPASKQGELEADDLIERVAQEDQSPVDVVGWNMDAVIGLIRGKKGTKVRLYVKKKDGSTKEIKITRDVIIFDEGYAKSKIVQLKNRPEKFGYLLLPSFYFNAGRRGGERTSATDIRKELQKLNDEQVDGIVFDLRNNSGGSLQDVIKIAGLFIEDGPVVQVKPRSGEPIVMSDKDKKAIFDKPVVVLVNQYSASASEILAAALQDYNRAIIMGSETFGKGTVQRFYNLDNAMRKESDFKPLGELKVTNQKFYRIDGSSTQLRGVTPDVIVPNPYDKFQSGEKDYSHALPWTEIAPASNYEQNVYVVKDKPQIVSNCQNRINNSPVFERVRAYADLLKQNSDNSIFSLNEQKYTEDLKAREEALKAYEELYPKVENLTITDLMVDKNSINSDSTKIERNQNLLESLGKDAELEQALFLIGDLIDNQG